MYIKIVVVAVAAVVVPQYVHLDGKVVFYFAILASSGPRSPVVA